ncbi:MAG: hypothetical protein BJ554DRAFT_2356 [Olpidium bornovanus]|uniref:Uncharacterized protein n=1 Tax=Olpidium bornovanus TaxID=278681 RepID=A0A8H7ZQ32_9FUNG|nr:MAG: hypothetical protein BJ554DRAFT_2356 [Olpidium bornovanus]
MRRRGAAASTGFCAARTRAGVAGRHAVRRRCLPLLLRGSAHERTDDGTDAVRPAPHADATGRAVRGPAGPSRSPGPPAAPAGGQLAVFALRIRQGGFRGKNGKPGVVGGGVAAFPRLPCASRRGDRAGGSARAGGGARVGGGRRAARRQRPLPSPPLLSPPGEPRQGFRGRGRRLDGGAGGRRRVREEEGPGARRRRPRGPRERASRRPGAAAAAREARGLLAVVVAVRREREFQVRSQPASRAARGPCRGERRRLRFVGGLPVGVAAVDVRRGDPRGRRPARRAVFLPGQRAAGRTPPALARGRPRLFDPRAGRAADRRRRRAGRSLCRGLGGHAPGRTALCSGQVGGGGGRHVRLRPGKASRVRGDAAEAGLKKGKKKKKKKKGFSGGGRSRGVPRRHQLRALPVSSPRRFSIVFLFKNQPAPQPSSALASVFLAPIHCQYYLRTIRTTTGTTPSKVCRLRRCLDTSECRKISSAPGSFERNVIHDL